MQLSVKRDKQSAAFFDAAADGTLLALQCDNCGRWVTPYVIYGSVSPLCGRCHTGRLEWRPTAGSGTLITWTLIPGTSLQVSGIVELTEGPWLTCALDIPLGDLAVGLPVRVGFISPGGGESIPVFRAR